MSLEFITERLVLRPLSNEDTPALFAIFSDPHTVQFTEWEPFKTTADAAWLVNWATEAAKQQPRTVFVWGIGWRAAEPTDILGIATLIRRDLLAHEADCGYIVKRSLWGRGIATEAMQSQIFLACVFLRENVSPL